MTTHLNGFAIFGAIEAKWLEKGGQRGILGVPTGNEEPAFNGVDRDGRIQRFAGGVIAWHPRIGAHEVHGAIAARWHALGEVKFGYPTTDEQTPPHQAGRYNHFRAMHALPHRPESSIYWHNNVGAHEVYGEIRTHWASLGWETSKAGYPAGSERPRRGAGRIQDFQTGAIA